MNSVPILETYCMFFSQKNLPRVALLGSGGGQRANVGFLGVIQQLYKEELLDGFLYVAGVSGSTWSVSVYVNGIWQRFLSKVCNKKMILKN